MNESRFLVTDFFIVKNRMNTIKELIEVGEYKACEVWVCKSKTGCRGASGIVLNCPRITFYSDPGRTVSFEDAEEYRRCIDRRAALEPVAYITGEKNLWDWFSGFARCAYPRPDTESLVEAILEKLSHRLSRIPSIHMFLIVYRKRCDRSLSEIFVSSAAVTLTDISGKALKVAAENALNLGFQTLQ